VIVFIGQLLISFSLSGIVAVTIGWKLYTLLAGILSAVVTGMLLGVPGKHDTDAEDGFGGFAWKDLGIAAATGVFLGTTWPALPIIVVWGAVRTRAAIAASCSADQRDL